MVSNKKIGNFGEEEAINFLIKNGFEILKRNYRYGHYEIDIIAEKNKCLHFVEVKKRKNNIFGEPEDFVSYAQKERIRQAAEMFINEIEWTYDISFDIISINDNPINICFFQDAF